MNTIKLVLVCLFVSFTLLLCLRPNTVIASESEVTTPESELVKALNKETEEVYQPYVELIEGMKGETDYDAIVSRFSIKITLWTNVYNLTEPIYRKHVDNSDSAIAEIAKKGLLSSQKGKEFLSLYRQGLLEDDSARRSDFLEQGDASFQSALEYHDQAVDLYNDYSGVTSSLESRNFLILLSVLSSIFTLMIFLKSRNISILDTDIIKSNIYRRLAISSLWMSGGLIITTVGLSYALSNGGTYYIFWGAVVFGGWELLKGLYNYFVNDRRILSELAKEQRSSAMRKSFSEKDVIGKNYKKILKCGNCGSKQQRNSIICSECGTNLL